jgi:citrate lyase subunit beta / citryl-CoA lyase
MDFLRSLMFVPGSRQRMLDKALGLENLDVALFDLEDGVAPSEKPTARQLIAETLARPPGGPTRFVRINAVGSGPERIEADLPLVIRPGLAGLVVPKVERVEDIRCLETELEQREPAVGLPRGSVTLIAAIESAIGLVNAPAIAVCSPRLLGLMFGAEDYALDLGLPPNREAEARELIFARSALVNAAASAHIASFDGVWPDIHDLEGVRRDALQARRLGFTGKTTFHPGQIDIINAVFSPTEAEADYAQRIVDAFDEAVARGEGSIAFGGQLLDLPIVERARRVLRVRAALASA